MKFYAKQIIMAIILLMAGLAKANTCEGLFSASLNTKNEQLLVQEAEQIKYYLAKKHDPYVHKTTVHHLVDAITKLLYRKPIDLQSRIELENDLRLIYDNPILLREAERLFYYDRLPIVQAARIGSLTAVQKYVNEGAKPLDLLEALKAAIDHDQVSIVKRLVEAGATSVTENHIFHGLTLLQYASAKPNIHKALIQSGVRE